MSPLHIHQITSREQCLSIEGHAPNMSQAIMILKQFNFCEPIQLQKNVNEVYFST